jgi:hypothetical protein
MREKKTMTRKALIGYFKHTDLSYTISVEVLLVENKSLQRKLRTANRTIAQLRRSNERRDVEMAALITAHHTKKMFLLNNLERRMDGLMNLHHELTDQVQVQENRVTTAPAEDKPMGSR